MPQLPRKNVINHKNHLTRRRCEAKSRNRDYTTKRLPPPKTKKHHYMRIYQQQSSRVNHTIRRLINTELYTQLTRTIARIDLLMCFHGAQCRSSAHPMRHRQRR